MRRNVLAALLLGTLALAPFQGFAQTAAAPAAEQVFSDKQRAYIDATIKQYISDNPQVLISSVEAFYNKQNETKKIQEGPLTQFPAGLLDYPGTPFAGPKDAKVVMVEFFDYNCGYCKQVATDVERIIADEPNLKFVFKELPILSETSTVAARYALASNSQGKYLAYHNALMEHQGPVSEDFLIETAKSVGLDVEKLKKDANTQEVRDQLAKNVDLARDLGVRGTPFFIVGKQKVPGAIGFSKMKEMIAAERGDVPAAPAAAPAAPAAPAASVDEDDTVSIDAPAVKDGVATAPATTPTTPAAPTITPTTTTGGFEGPTTTGSSEASSEVSQARAEAQAMIEDLKREAAEMQKQAADAQKAAADAQKAAAKVEAKAKAKK